MSFSPFNWIRDALGIRKDLIDIEKSKLEVQRLKDEQITRNLVARPTLEDINKYDPKLAKLAQRIIEQKSDLRIRISMLEFLNTGSGSAGSSLKLNSKQVLEFLFLQAKRNHARRRFRTIILILFLILLVIGLFLGAKIFMDF
jgi:hypothetical protein